MSLREARRLRPWLVSVIVMRSSQEGAQVLLMKRVGHLDGAWCQVAGKIETGETAWQAALRELREETGLAPDEFYSADICEQFYEHGSDEIVIAPVFVAKIAADSEVVLNKEHSEFAWMSFDMALEKVSFAGQRRVLAEVKDSFITHSPSPFLKMSL